ERNDQRVKLMRVDPAPCAELGMLSGEVDIQILAEEAIEEPGLALPAPFAFPYLADQIVGQIVIEFAGRLGDQLDLVVADADLLAEFANRRLAGGLPGIDPALRHFP